jgi:hypothetical protein
MSDDEEQVGAGAGELEAQAAASLSLRKAPRLTVAAVRDQMVAEIAQLRQDNREMAKVVTAAVLDALRGQVQQLHQGQGQFAGVEEAGRAEQAQYQQQHAQGAQQPPQPDQFANFCPSVAFGQLREGGEAQQAGSSAGFRETFANLLSQGYAAKEAKRAGDRAGGSAMRADDDSLAKNPTWRPNFLIAKAQLRVGNSLCATFVPALLVRHGSVQNFLEDSILRDKWNERDKHEASTLALVLDAFIRAQVDLHEEYCEIVYRRFVGIVYHAKDGSWTIADELLRPFQKSLRLVDDDVTDSALLLAATRAKIEAQHAAIKKRNGNKAEDPERQ